MSDQTISATKYAKGKYCPLLANTVLNASSMNRGRKTHNILSKYSKNSYLFELLSRDDSKTNVSVSLHIDGVKLTGIIDLLVNNTLYEWKTGKREAWHVDQVMFYLFITNLKVGYISYLDTGEKVKVKNTLTFHSIKKVINKIESKQPTRNDLCGNCKLKSTCSKWNISGDKYIKQAIRLYKKHKELKSEIIHKTEDFKKELSIYNKQLQHVDEKLETVKSILKLYDTNNYVTDDAIVRIFNNSKITVDVEKYPYNRYPSYYTEPTPIIRKMKSDFGVTVPDKTIRIELNNHENI